MKRAALGVLLGTLSWTMAGVTLAGSTAFFGLPLYSFIGELTRTGFFELLFRQGNCFTQSTLLHACVGLTLGQDVFLSLSTASVVPLLVRVLGRRIFLFPTIQSIKWWFIWPLELFVFLPLTIIEFVAITTGSYFVYYSIWTPTTSALGSISVISITRIPLSTVELGVTCCAVFGTVLGFISVAAKRPTTSLSVCLGVFSMYVAGGILVLVVASLLGTSSGYTDLAKGIAILLTLIGGILDTNFISKYLKRYDSHFCGPPRTTSWRLVPKPPVTALSREQVGRILNESKHYSTLATKLILVFGVAWFFPNILLFMIDFLYASGTGPLLIMVGLLTLSIGLWRNDREAKERKRFLESKLGRNYREIVKRYENRESFA